MCQARSDRTVSFVSKHAHPPPVDQLGPLIAYLAVEAGTPVYDPVAGHKAALIIPTP